MIYNLLYALTLLGSTIYVRLFKFLNLLFHNEKVVNIVLVGGIYVVNFMYAYINTTNKNKKYLLILLFITTNTIIYSFILLMVVMLA